MAKLRTAIGSTAALIVLAGTVGAGAATLAQGGGALSPGYLDQLLAPVALYPDQLLAQVLLCAGNARKVGELGAFLVAVVFMAGGPLLASAGAAPVKAPRTFATPEEAVRVLVDTVKAGDLQRLTALFGPGGQELVDTSDPATGRRNREVFAAAVAEGWRLADAGPGRKEVVLGNEAWPFPVPLVRGAAGWSFDAAAGKEAAGVQPGALDPGTQNGLYWPARRGQPRSPLGVLVAQASEEGYRRKAGEGPSSGIMTFIVGQDGIPYEKDLGPETHVAVKSLTRYDPDQTWGRVRAREEDP